MIHAVRVLAARRLAERARALIQVAPRIPGRIGKKRSNGSCDASGQISSTTFPA
jgi:hypothetical protein